MSLHKTNESPESPIIHETPTATAKSHQRQARIARAQISWLQVLAKSVVQSWSGTNVIEKNSSGGTSSSTISDSLID